MASGRTTVCRQTGYNPQQIHQLRQMVDAGVSDAEILEAFEFIEPESTRAWLDALRPKPKPPPTKRQARS